MQDLAVWAPRAASVTLRADGRDLPMRAGNDGWWFVGRPTLEELRHDLRTIMAARTDYDYAACTTPEVRRIRIPQQEWAEGAPPLGASGLPVAEGVVKGFDPAAGVGMIATDECHKRSATPLSARRAQATPARRRAAGIASR